jgi:hypothetical protein
MRNYQDEVLNCVSTTRLLFMRRIAILLLLLPSKGLVAQELPLYNGAEYTGFYRNTNGHPFFKSDSLVRGDVFYDHVLYRNILLGYNILDDQVYIKQEDPNFNIQLVNSKLDYFIISGHRFERIDNQYYELLQDGAIRAFEQHSKTLRQGFTAADQLVFTEYNKYFIEKDNHLYLVKNRSSVLSFLGDKKEEVRKFISDTKINYRKDPGKAITAAIDRYNSIIHWIKPAKKTAIEEDTSVAQTPRSYAKKNTTSLEENKLLEIGNASGVFKDKVTLAGYVRESNTGEPIVGATISADPSKTSITTDQFGYYALSVVPGRHTIRISYAGMKDTKRQVNIMTDGSLDVLLQEKVASLKAVLVVAEKNSRTKNTQMSVEKINIKTIKQVPVVFGEADVLRVVMTLPGVSSAGEAGTGFNVRGGSVDQNLILFSDATIYNPSHLFGFFSAFNPDVVKGVELYKSSIPEKYGGRLSSVLDVSAREGNSKKLSGVGGIGPLTSKLMLEGPLLKSKKNTGTTFILGGRTTYSNWILKALPNESYSNSKANFYDLNLNISSNVNLKNSIYLTGYMSSDQFRLNTDTTYSYGNKNANIKWKHVFNNQLYALLTVGYDHYEYSVQSESNMLSAFKLNFNINQAHARAEFNYSPSNAHSVAFGVNSVLYNLEPGTYSPQSKGSLIIPVRLQSERALETGFYIGDKYNVTPKLALNAGLRYSVYNYLGPQTVYQYAPGIPKDTSTIRDSVRYSHGKIIKTYSSPEYRLSARYALAESSSVKVSFNTTRQYIHMLSNTTVVSPTDIWKLSDNDIRPEEGYQLSAGYYKDFKSGTIETSFEVYYKRMKNVLDYKSGARLILNPHIAADVINAQGKSYGAELLVKKTAGKLNGWISYTYSRTLLRQDDGLAGEIINKGEYYPASFDKPHNVNVIANYRFTHRFSVSVNMVYNSGRPITIPISIFDLGGAQRVYYSERNQYRIPDYYRMDISMTIDGNHRVRQRTHNSWSFGAYNLTARKNPYSVYFVQQAGTIKGYQLSIFGTIIPFVTYNIRF